MKSNNIDDSPLFSDEEPKKPQLNLQQFQVEQENKRKNKTLEFCFSSAKWIALLAVIMVILDIVLKHFNIESTLIKDAFSLLTYIVTAALGFIFANNSK